MSSHFSSGGRYGNAPASNGFKYVRAFKTLDAMPMKTWPRILFLATMLSLAHASWAAETTTFESCTDVAGRTIPVEPDYAQPMLVRTTWENGHATIRHNPGVLPRLTFAVRQFFLAHECAHHAMGDAGSAASATRARQADCIGLSTLIASGLMQREDVAGLQRELNFTAAEWERLPGPPRNIDFAGCRQGNALRLPASAAPSTQQGEWNSCARGCGDRLWQCQRHCRGGGCEAACLDNHRQCEAACGPRQ
jgi:hypothetical protein